MDVGNHEMIKNEYYYGSFLSGSKFYPIIFQFFEIQGPLITYLYAIFPKSKRCFLKGNSMSFFNLPGENLRKATEDEINWLKYCIQENEFIHFDKQIKNNYEIY